MSKGFVFEQQYSHLLEDAKCIVLDIFENIPPGQTKKLKERIRASLRRFFRKIIDRDPRGGSPGALVVIQGPARSFFLATRERIG